VERDQLDLEVGERRRRPGGDLTGGIVCLARVMRPDRRGPRDDMRHAVGASSQDAGGSRPAHRPEDLVVGDVAHLRACHRRHGNHQGDRDNGSDHW